MKKLITILLTVLVLAGASFGVYYYFTNEDSESTLTILEKQWIEDNKNTIQEFSILNKIPVFSYEGEGLIYDFLTDLENDTGLEFSKLSYSMGSDVESPYAFVITNETNEKDVLIYQDNYVLVSKEEKKYDNLEDMEPMTIGVINDLSEEAAKYLNVSNNLTFTSYENVGELIEKFEAEDTMLNAIILPKTINLKEIVTEYYINYNITEMTQNYYIKLGDNDTLNTIIRKYYEKWSKENFDEVFGEYFTDQYLTFTNVSSDEKVTFENKQYVYGFINNEPYDKLINNKLLGLNSNILKAFSKLANIEISYAEFEDYNDLVYNFNNNQIDLFLNRTDAQEFKIDMYNTVPIIDSEIVIITHVNNDITINSLNSLADTKVVTLANNKISEELIKNGIEVKSHRTLNKLLRKVQKDQVIALDKKTYEMYSNTYFKEFNVNYQFNLENNYSYVVKNTEDNRVFYEYFDFFLSFMNDKSIKEATSTFEFTAENNNYTMKNILIASGFGLIVIIIIIIIRLVKKNKKRIQGITKENKLKYIDMLTSLKNRNYLNDNIEAWDSSEIYPQAIMIVDLNNVAYINDNYGHAEGDSVITEAANILIKNQLEQTEIMRTNGNEFLIYLVGYEEKQVVVYKKKLTKEFKELAHGFGAAVGYSMIENGLKTIDDAINEATLDMRTNKEETE